MEHKGTLNIQAENLLLRRFSLDDAEMMYHNWANDERVTRFLTWTPYKSVDDVRCFISLMLESYKNNDFYHWVIILDGQAIGSISVTLIDEKNHSCELGYCIGFDYWGKGVMTETMNSVIGFLFNEVKFNRIFAKYDVENSGSGKVMEKCGMVYEGRLRSHYRRHDGTYSDAKLLSIIIEDYIVN